MLYFKEVEFCLVQSEIKTLIILVNFAIIIKIILVMKTFVFVLRTLGG